MDVLPAANEENYLLYQFFYMYQFFYIHQLMKEETSADTHTISY